MKPKLIYLYFIIIWLSISSASILVRLSNAPGSVCAFWRLFITVLLITPIVIRRRSININYISIVSGLFLGLHFVFWMESLYLIPVFVSTVLVVTYPFYNLILDYILLHESISKIQALNLAVGFTAIVMYFTPWISKELDAIGLIYAFLGGLFAALYFTIGRFARRYKGVDLASYIQSAYITGAFVSLVYVMIHRVELIKYSPSTYVYFILMALIPMLGGHTLMNYLLKYVKTSTVTAVALGEPIGAGILAYMIFGETVDLYKLTLASIIMITLFMIIRSETTEK